MVKNSQTAQSAFTKCNLYRMSAHTNSEWISSTHKSSHAEIIIGCSHWTGSARTDTNVHPYFNWRVYFIIQYTLNASSSFPKWHLHSVDFEVDTEYFNITIVNSWIRLQSRMKNHHPKCSSCYIFTIQKL